MTTSELSHAQKQKPRLVVFDVEGVLLPKRRYLLFEASRGIGFIKFLKMLLAGALYETGLTSLENALRRVYRQLRGLEPNNLFHLYKRIPLMPSVKEVFKQLKKDGCKTALISSGLPQEFIEDLSTELGCDYAFGLDFEIVEGHLTGEISGDVIKHEGKARILKGIQEKEGLTPQDCALVADDRNNLPLFRLCKTRIGYNPDFLLANKSDAVVRGDLIEILPLVSGDPPEKSSVSKRDLLRETIHFAGFFVPVLAIYLSLNRYFVVFLIFLVTMIYMASELARMLGINFPVISTITWKAAIQPEIYEFVASPIFFATGIGLTLLIFTPPLSYASVAIFTIGDVSATLFGKEIGKHTIPYNKGKNIEGTLAGFLLASLGAYIFLLNPFRALVGAGVGMIVESLPTPINDNLTIPLAAALAMLLLP